MENGKLKKQEKKNLKKKNINIKIKLKKT